MQNGLVVDIGRDWSLAFPARQDPAAFWELFGRLGSDLILA